MFQCVSFFSNDVGSVSLSPQPFCCAQHVPCPVLFFACLFLCLSCFLPLLFFACLVVCWSYSLRVLSCLVLACPFSFTFLLSFSFIFLFSLMEHSVSACEMKAAYFKGTHIVDIIHVSVRRNGFKMQVLHSQMYLTWEHLKGEYKEDKWIQEAHTTSQAQSKTPLLTDLAWKDHAPHPRLLSRLFSFLFLFLSF